MFSGMAIALVGSVYIYVGLLNVKTQVATRKRGLIERAFGASSKYEGSKAVEIGWVRIAWGIGIIVLGVASVFVRPFFSDFVENNWQITSFLFLGLGVTMLLVLGALAFRARKLRRSLCENCGGLNSQATRLCQRCMAKP